MPIAKILLEQYTPCPVVLGIGWRLWTCRSCQPLSASIVGHCYVCYSAYLHSSRRSGIYSCWTTTVEQPSVQHTTVWPYHSAVLPGVNDVFGWRDSST